MTVEPIVMIRGVAGILSPGAVAGPVVTVLRAGEVHLRRHVLPADVVHAAETGVNVLDIGMLATSV